MKFLAEAVAFHKHCEDRESLEEDPSEEDLSDAGQKQQQLMGDQKTPPKSRAAMPPLLRKEAVKQKTEEVSSGKGVKNLSI